MPKMWHPFSGETAKIHLCFSYVLRSGSELFELRASNIYESVSEKEITSMVLPNSY